MARIIEATNLFGLKRDLNSSSYVTSGMARHILLATLRDGLSDLLEEMQGDIEGAPETLGRDQTISGYIRTIEWLLKETK